MSHDLIGAGTFAEVRAVDSQTVCKTFLSKGGEQVPIRDVLIHDSVQGVPGVACVFSSVFSGSNVEMYVERGTSDLKSHIREHGLLGAEGALQFLFQMSQTLSCLHSLGIFHMDVKCENIIVRKDATYLLTDFGVASVGPTSCRRLLPVCSPKCKPPEVVWETSKMLGAEVDVYALGCTALELIFTPDELFLSERTSEYGQIMALAKFFGTSSNDQIIPCDFPVTRPASHWLAVRHSNCMYTNGLATLVERMCSWDFRKRPTAREVCAGVAVLLGYSSSFVDVSFTYYNGERTLATNSNKIRNCVDWWWEIYANTSEKNSVAVFASAIFLDVYLHLVPLQGYLQTVAAAVLFLISNILDDVPLTVPDIREWAAPEVTSAAVNGQKDHILASTFLRCWLVPSVTTALEKANDNGNIQDAIFKYIKISSMFPLCPVEMPYLYKQFGQVDTRKKKKKKI